MAQNRQPKTIFEQILFGQEITNENVVALAENLDVINKKLDALISIFATTQTEPTASGEEQTY